METNAIEGVFATDRGFTRTVAMELQGWEDELESRGAHVRPAFEDALNGYELALDLATGKTPMSQLAIREMHARMTASQGEYRVRTSVGWQDRKLDHGEYKRYPNSPTRTDGTIHHYAAPEEVQAEMAKLIDEISSNAFQQAHPVVQASYIHYAFVVIHPFADGNGRVSRALAGVYLLRNPGIPFVMFSDRRGEYLDALEHADTGNYRPFIDFVEQRTIDALSLAVDHARLSSGPSAEDLLKEIGGSDEEMAGDRLMDAVFTAVEKKILGLNVPPQLEFHVSPVVSTKFLTMCSGGQLDVPVGGEVRLVYDNQLRVVNRSIGNKYEPFRDLMVEQRQVLPVIDEVTRRRIELWAEDYVRYFVEVSVTQYRSNEIEPH